MTSSEETEVLKGIANGDEAVIKVFYEKNLRYIRSFILQNSGNENDVEDVFQDSLLVLFQKLKSGSLEINCSVHTYFYAICKNIWRNRLRRNHKIVLTDELPHDRDVIATSVIDDMICMEREHLYRKYFLRLGDKCRTVLNLVFEGNTMREISEITGYSEGYARKKKFECKKTLLEMIEKDPIYRELKTPSRK